MVMNVVNETRNAFVEGWWGHIIPSNTVGAGMSSKGSDALAYDRNISEDKRN